MAWALNCSPLSTPAGDLSRGPWDCGASVAVETALGEMADICSLLTFGGIKMAFKRQI